MKNVLTSYTRKQLFQVLKIADDELKRMDISGNQLMTFSNNNPMFHNKLWQEDYQFCKIFKTNLFVMWLIKSCKLDLGWCKLSHSHLEELALIPWTRPVELNLAGVFSQHQIEENGQDYFALSLLKTGRYFSSLNKLNLSVNQLTRTDVDSFSKWPLRSLKTLLLTYCNLVSEDITQNPVVRLAFFASFGLDSKSTGCSWNAEPLFCSLGKLHSKAVSSQLSTNA